MNFPLENAFYGDADGDGVGDVAFGQGAGIDFADVIYHEFGARDRQRHVVRIGVLAQAAAAAAG